MGLPLTTIDLLIDLLDTKWEADKRTRLTLLKRRREVISRQERCCSNQVTAFLYTKSAITADFNEDDRLCLRVATIFCRSFDSLQIE